MNPPRRSVRFSMPLLRRVVCLVVPYWGRFCIGLLALGMGAITTLILPEIAGQALGTTGALTFREHPERVIVVVTALFIVQALCFYTRAYCLSSVGQHVVTDLRDRLFRTFLAQPVAYFDSHRTGDLVSRLSADTQLLQETVSIRFSVLLRYSLQVIGGIVMMLIKSLTLSLAVLGLLPLLAALSIALATRLRRLSRAQQEALGTATHLAEESLFGVRLVKGFQAETYAADKFQEANTSGLNLGLARSKLSAFFQSFVNLLMNLSMVAVLVIGAFLYQSGSISIAALTSFLLYGMVVAVSFAFLAGTVAEMQQSLGAAERVFEILDAPQSESPPASSMHPRGQGEVSFAKVTFHYPSRPQHAVLREVSFKCPPQKMTAIVGPSGAGKSSLVHLLMGFYSPTSGKVMIDGVAVEEIDRAALVHLVAFVPQDTQLFSMTIRENLLWGNPKASDAELERVCRAVNLWELLSGFPLGFDTDVGTKGVQLSGGQRQRLAIARALLRSPRILILDEATSALDSENESIIRRAVRAIEPACTVIVIAHRLSTIRDADQLLVLEHGVVVQQGTHESLLRTPGLYRTLVERQELMDDVPGTRGLAEEAV